MHGTRIVVVVRLRRDKMCCQNAWNWSHQYLEFEE